MWKLRDEEDISRSTVLDKRLHFLIAEAAGNQLIMVILRAMNETIEGFISHIRERTMRDESYRKRLQEGRAYASTLQSVPGVGPATAKALLAHFKTVGAVKAASEDELAAVKGVSRRAAKALREAFGAAKLDTEQPMRDNVSEYPSDKEETI